MAVPAPSEVNSKIKFTSTGKGLKNPGKQKKPQTRIQDKFPNRSHLKLDITQPRFQFLKDKWKIPN